MRGNVSRRWVGLLVWSWFCLAAGGQADAPRPAATPAEAAALADFNARIAAYQHLLKAAESHAPKLKSTASAEALQQSRDTIAEQVRAARAKAKPGDLLTPAIAALDRGRIAACMAGPKGRDIRASLRNAEPLPGMTVRVNQRYPTPVPLQSMPPDLLALLPPLPQGLEYRIVGRELILYDTATNLVLDVAANAMPPG